MLAGDSSNNNDYFSVSGGSSTTYVGDDGAGTHIYFHTAPGTGDLVSIVAWGESDNTLAVPKSGGTFTGTVSHTGTLDVSGGTLTTSTPQKTAIVDGGKGNLAKGDVGLSNVTNDAQVPASGGTFSGDVSFGDNKKAQFGAGDDLQILHDGSNSYITDEGTGTLRIRSSNQLVLQVSDGAGGWENALLADDNGAVTLRHNNSNKLATTSTGIDVTGNVKLSANGGINFSAYATSGNPSSNLLDDYEEGTWTPTFNNGWAGTSQYEAYTKIGRQVTVQTKLYIDTEASASLSIGSLPFNVDSSLTGAVSCVMIKNLQAVNYSQIHAYSNADTSNFTLYGNNTTGNWVTIKDTDTTTNTEIYVTLTYITN